MSAATGFKHAGTFERGVHPPERKGYSENESIEILPTPEKVDVPILQNIGAPCEPIVKSKQEVVFGEKIARGKGFVSAPIFSPINGKVQKLSVVTLPNGRHVSSIPIRAQGDQISLRELREIFLGGVWPNRGIETIDPEVIRRQIAEAGIVGLGGAAFPTHVKYAPNEKKPIDTVLINGCECEPYLTSDTRLMIECPEAVVTGALLVKHAAGAKRIVIGLEDNKPEAIKAMQRAAGGSGMEVAVLPTKYPQGSEKQLIMAILKRAVPLGGLPLDVGVAVTNVGTAHAMAAAVIRGRPLTHRIVCVTGAGIRRPRNLLAPIGAPARDLIAACGGFTEDAVRMIAGGPMMGFAFTDLNTPVTKGTSGFTVLSAAELKQTEETNCVRCGRCVDVCPMNLVPTKLALASRNKDVDLLERYSAPGCFECGCCAYICPANLPIVQLVRTGKAMVMAARKKAG